MAPEVIKKTGYSYLADYYSFGCVIFELMNGKPPFVAETKQGLFDAVLNHDPVIPPHWSKELQDFVGGLLEKLPEDRLGATGGFSELSRHPWLRGLNVTNIKNKTVKPPITIDPNMMCFRPKPADSDILEDTGACKLLVASDANQLPTLDSVIFKPPEELMKIKSKEFLLSKHGTLDKFQNIVIDDRLLPSHRSAGQFDKKTGMTFLAVPSQADTNAGTKVRMTASIKSRGVSPEESILTGTSEKTPNNTDPGASGASPTSSINDPEDFQTMINEIRGFDRAPSEKMANYRNSTKSMGQTNIRSPYYNHRERDKMPAKSINCFSLCCN